MDRAESGPHRRGFGIEQIIGKKKTTVIPRWRIKRSRQHPVDRVEEGIQSRGMGAQKQNIRANFTHPLAKTTTGENMVMVSELQISNMATNLFPTSQILMGLPL